uniref:Uncharacterized protein n=1 Tax=Anguilla anguilla TaxID=7936 RepID=A0A0E9VCD9_ANGAN
MLFMFLLDQVHRIVSPPPAHPQRAPFLNFSLFYNLQFCSTRNLLRFKGSFCFENILVSSSKNTI